MQSDMCLAVHRCAAEDVMMNRTAALILNNVGPTLFLGLDLITRAALTAARAGIEHIHIVSNESPDTALLNQLSARRVDVTYARESDGLFATAPMTDRLLVIPVQAIVEPDALRAIADAPCEPGDG
jgi:hypothetical protein